MIRWTALPLILLLSACLSHPPPPPAPQQPYRAIGHSPEWTLVIDEMNISFFREGQAPVVQTKPAPIIGFAGEIYQTPRIGVNLPHVGCTDPVTGISYRDRAEVDVDGVRYQGCGGEAAAR